MLQWAESGDVGRGNKTLRQHGDTARKFASCTSTTSVSVADRRDVVATQAERSDEFDRNEGCDSIARKSSGLEFDQKSFRLQDDTCEASEAPRRRQSTRSRRRTLAWWQLKGTVGHCTFIGPLLWGSLLFLSLRLPPIHHQLLVRDLD